MRFGKRLSVYSLLLVVALSGYRAHAQDPPVNASLVGSWDQYAGDYGDVWADGDYAYIGSFTLLDGMAATVRILDISDPSNPTLAATFNVPAPNQFRSPQDVKVGDGLLFIGLESGGTDVVSIVDVRVPTTPVELTTIALSGWTKCHNTFYDNGRLFIVDSSTPRVAIVDLNGFDPDNPPPGPITTAMATINIPAPGGSIHDVTVKDGRLYAANIASPGTGDGLFVYDISMLGIGSPVLLGSVPGDSTHSMWPSDDGEFVVTGEERANGGIKVYRMTDDGNGGLDLTQTDSLVLSSDAFSVHNQVMVGNRVYVSWYQAGLQVFDIDAISGDLEFFASYDTSAFGNNGGYSGNWGVYPFLGSDKVVLSDIEEGLFIVEVQEPALDFGYPQGRPEFASPDGDTMFTTTILPVADDPVPGTAQLFTSIDGGPFSPTAMSVDGDEYSAMMPAAPCGSDIEYYVQIETMGGDTITDPNDAPTATFKALSALGTQPPVVSFNFEDATGWSVTGDASSGDWEAGVPIDDGADGEPTTDFDGSGQCYLTENASGNFDVDGGSTTLTSPALDASSLTDPFVSYARWYSNTAGASPASDIFVVEISNNGADWIELETVGPSGPEVSGGWIEKSFLISDYVAPTSTVFVRFTASDEAPGSLVEAAVDAVSVYDLQCVAGEQGIPAVSDWGLIVVALTVLVGGSLLYRRHPHLG